MVCKLVENKKRTYFENFCTENIGTKGGQFFKISQNSTFWDQERGILAPEIGCQREMDYFIAFSSKRVKRVKGVRYIWIFWKIWILRFLDDFWPKSRFTLFGTLFTLFLLGFQSIVLRIFAPQMVLKLTKCKQKGT